MIIRKDSYMINRKLVSDFADVIGNLTTAIHIESLNVVKRDYEIVLNELLEWIKYYYKSKNLDIINHNNSLKRHELLKKQMIR